MYIETHYMHYYIALFSIFIATEHYIAAKKKLLYQQNSIFILINTKRVTITFITTK